MRRAQHSGHGHQVAIIGIVAACLIAWAALVLFLPANADTLKVHLGTLRTCAAEGLTLARADDEARTTGPFYSVELDLLRKDAEETATRLESDRAQTQLRPRFAEAASIAHDISRHLQALGSAGASKESVVAAQATLVALQQRVRQMEQELTP